TNFTAEAGKVYRFRLDYTHYGNPGGLLLCATGSGISDQSCGTGQGTRTWTFLSPDYSLPTTTKIYDSTLGDATTTIGYGANPELSLPQSTATDPSGLNLTTTSTYEQPGVTGSFLRKTSTSLPGNPSTNP